jgi:hypothetical protein
LIDNPGASFLTVGDAGRGGVLGDAVGHAVEGEFITYVWTKSHRSPLYLPQRHKGTKKTGSQIYHKDAKTRRARELCAFVTWWFLTSLRARQVTPFKGSSSLMLGRKGMEIPSKKVTIQPCIKTVWDVVARSVLCDEAIPKRSSQPEKREIASPQKNGSQ